MALRSGNVPILIVGAGIGGLSAAIALARKGVRCRVLERSIDIPAEGAGIQLGPNATRILDKWGVLDRLIKYAVEPDSIIIRDGRTGNHLASVALGRQARSRHGAPYLSVHRADLHQTLHEHVRSLNEVRIERGFEVKNIETANGMVTAVGKGGAHMQGIALIGADGIRSKARELVAPGANLIPSGKSAWRSLVPVHAVPDQFRSSQVNLWMAPATHVVHYPVHGGELMNIVAVINEPVASADWNTPGDKRTILHNCNDLSGDVAELIQVGESWRVWALMEMNPLGSWTRGPIALLGDAAHPVLPFLAQGGGLAIEDADVVANCLTGQNADIPRSLEAYAQSRRGRAKAVRTASRNMGWIYHLGGLAAAARNFALQWRSPESLLRQYDWLYGFRTGGD